MASPRLIFDAIKRRCADVESQFQGYDHELMISVMSVLGREREHRIAQTNVQQKVEDEVEKLGDLIWQRTKSDA